MREKVRERGCLEIDVKKEKVGAETDRLRENRGRKKRNRGRVIKRQTYLKREMKTRKRTRK